MHNVMHNIDQQTEGVLLFRDGQRHTAARYSDLNTAGPGFNESAHQHSVKRKRALHCKRSHSGDRISQGIVGLHEGKKEILVVSLYRRSLAVWRADCLDRGLGCSALYIYTLLA